jgi:two-component system, chemotaxis family, chemotaxis protein CheY
MRALVVEDSITIRMILCRYLREMNIGTVEAADGRQALVQLEEMPRPDLVLVDWDMPIMTGIEFIRVVRDRRLYDRLPLIMITTHSETEYVSEAIEAGADAYIQKPCTLDALHEKLAALGLLERK